MLQELIRSVIDSFVAPRQAARRVIDNVTDFQGVAVIFGLSVTLSAIIVLVQSGFNQVAAAELDKAGGAFPAIIALFVYSAISFAFFSAVVYGVGRLFGGVGSFLNVAAAMAWHSLITVVFAPFLSLSSLTAESGASMVTLFMLLFILWLLINFAAEAHQFKSVWKVAAVTVGLLFVPALLVTFAGLNAM